MDSRRDRGGPLRVGRVEVVRHVVEMLSPALPFDLAGEVGRRTRRTDSVDRSSPAPLRVLDRDERHVGDELSVGPENTALS